MGQHIGLAGEVEMHVHGSQECKLPMHVVSHEGPPLLGHNWLKYLGLIWPAVQEVIIEPLHAMNSQVQALLKKYQAMFMNELGGANSIKACLKIREDSVPRFVKSRPMPYALNKMF